MKIITLVMLCGIVTSSIVFAADENLKCRGEAEKAAEKMALRRSDTSNVVSSREFYASIQGEYIPVKELYIVEMSDQTDPSEYVVVAQPIYDRKTGRFTNICKVRYVSLIGDK